MAHKIAAMQPMLGLDFLLLDPRRLRYELWSRMIWVWCCNRALLCCTMFLVPDELQEVTTYWIRTTTTNLQQKRAKASLY
jgi:hypothetical protein